MDGALMATSILHGSYPNFMFEGNPESYGKPYRFDPLASEISASLRSVTSEIASRIHDSPMEYLQWYLIGKPINLFSWGNIQGMGDIFLYPVNASPYFDKPHFVVSRYFMYVVHVPLVILALSGSVFAWVKKNNSFLVAHSLFFMRCISLLLIYFIIVHIIAAPFPRYSIPMLPVIYGMAIYAVLQMYHWTKKKHD